MKKIIQILLVTALILTIYIYKASPVSAAWSTDSRNYFNEWQCTSTIGINHIAKLDILPLSSPNKHKDSLHADFRDMVGGNPTLQFSVFEQTPYMNDPTRTDLSWHLEKAIYNTTTNNWDVSSWLGNPPPNGGVSSFDGDNSDFVMNEYLINGWGPTANKPGSQSKIPGVSENHEPNGYDGTVGYPLYGTGPLGITTIRNTLSDPGGNYFNSLNSCLHMNPTLFDFDAGGVPHALGLFLYTRDVSIGCTVNGTVLQPGYYVYRFDNTAGWQIDLNAGLLDGGQSINYAWGSDEKFLTGDFGAGKIQIADLHQPPPRSPQTVLDCSTGNVYVTEISGKENVFYFLSGQLNPLVATHDIYVAFNDTGQQTLPGDLDGNGKVDIFDYNALASKFGNPYTLSDYNNLVANFGR